MILLNLNDGNTFISERQIRMDVALPFAKPPKKYADIDGSQFRGGKYNRPKGPHSPQLNSVPSTGAPDLSTLTMNKSSTSNRSFGGNTPPASANPSSPPIEKQRPTLNLMPRSKPVVGIDDKDASGINHTVEGRAKIFGGAKPRDDSNWTSVKVTHENDTEKGKGRQQDPSVGARSKSDNVDEHGTTVEDAELKAEAAVPTSSNHSQKREKKVFNNRGPKNVEDDRTSASGPQRSSDYHREDRRTKRDYQQAPKESMAVKHESKAKDPSSRAAKDKSKGSADGWVAAPSNVQKDKRVVTPVVSAPIVEKTLPTKANPIKKSTNLYDAFNDEDDTDAD